MRRANTVPSPSRAAAMKSRWNRRSSRRLGHWVYDYAGQDGGPDGMKLVLEGRDDAEVAATATKAPEQVRVLLLACPYHLSIGGYDVGGEQGVASETVLRCQVAEATPQREARDTGGGDDPC